MDLVEQEQRVVSEKPCMDWTHHIADAVSAKEKPRSDLIDSRYSNERLIGPPCPCVVTRHSTAQLNVRQRIVCAAQQAEAGPHLAENAVCRAGERMSDCLCTLECLVHDGAPIHYHDDARGSAPLTRRSRGLERKVKYCDVDRGGLSRPRRQIEERWPATFRGHAGEQPLLPWERGMAVNRLEVLSEVGRG
jgi:hypothetical protein